jgi:transposase-like protein
MADEIIRCPACGTDQVQKYGTSPSGAQKYRCMKLGCRRQFTLGADHLIDPGIKTMVMRMIDGGVDPKVIHRTVNDQRYPNKISLRWIQELKRRKLND